MQLKLLQLPKVRLSTTQRLILFSSVSALIIICSIGMFVWFNSISKESKAGVTLNSFVASLNTPSVQVQWVTQDESENAFFSLERSSNAQDYETIYEAPGSGTSQTQNIYSYTDYAPLSGVSYYRLKQTDYDGTETYSAIQSVNNEIITGESGSNSNPLNNISFNNVPASNTTHPTGELTNNEFSNLSAYPLNATDRLSISVDAEVESNATVSIVDISGNVLKSFTLPFSEGKNLKQLDVNFLPAGIYFITMIDNAGHRSTQKFIKAN